MATIDWLLVLAFATYAIVAGLRARRAAGRGPEEYFLAGRSLSGTGAGLSMAATQYAADTPLVLTGLVATSGVFALWRFWSYSVAFLLLGFLLGGPWRRAGVLTDAELAEARYAPPAGEWLRYAKAVYYGVLFNSVVLAMVLLAATRIAEPFLRWHEWLPRPLLAPLAGALEAVGLGLAADPHAPGAALVSASNLISLVLVVAVTALYSMLGGLRSVVATDVVQIALALGATALYAGAVVAEVGGLEALPERLATIYGADAAGRVLSFAPLGEGGSAAVLALLAFQWIAQANSDGTGYLAQRTMACRSDRDARLASMVFTYVQTVLRTLLWLPIAVGLLVLYPRGEGALDDAAVAARELTFVTGITDHLPPGMLGLMLVGLLAALASTIDTHLNWGASYLTHDLYGRLWCERLRGQPAGPRRLVWVGRASTALVLAVALVVVACLGSIQQAWKTSLLFGAATGVPLLLRWVWHRQTAWGELAPMAAGLVAAPLLLALASDAVLARYGVAADTADALRVLAMAAFATIVSVTASLLGPPVPAERLVAFYRRVRPPGFWRPIARLAGDDPVAPRRDLVRAAAAIAAGAGSVFALVVACGTWLLGSPVPPGLARGPWVGGLVCLGAILGPLAWRLGERQAGRDGRAAGEGTPR